ncbi:hypothetical protein, partial [Streptomyces sp. SID13588]|uniref:hypothetical protein n=1 Tax=Streptomyces sp. SID13588 TaxID=2706051 RepID=UPI001942965C
MPAREAEQERRAGRRAQGGGAGSRGRAGAPDSSAPGHHRVLLPHLAIAQQFRRDRLQHPRP